MTVLKLHRWNAGLFGIFIVMHFVTHLSGLWGIDSYNATQAMLRHIYRHPVVEPLVIISALGQIIWGVQLLWRKWRRGLRGRWMKTQVYSGGIVLLFMVQHLSALGLARLWDGLDTTFYWPAAVMSGVPFIWYFAPYYFAGVRALFVHLGCGLRLLALRGGARAYGNAVFWGCAALGLGLAVLIDLMLLGYFYDITLPPEWQGYLQKFIPG